MSWFIWCSYLLWRINTKKKVGMAVCIYNPTISSKSEGGARTKAVLGNPGLLENQESGEGVSERSGKSREGAGKGGGQKGAWEERGGSGFQNLHAERMQSGI